MTTLKAKAAYFGLGALLTIFALYPTLKLTMREQQFGLLLSPEEVKITCGKPQIEDWTGYALTYIEGDRRVELQFMTANHRMYLNKVKWASSKGGVGQITKVSRDSISDWVKQGWLPACLEQAAR